MKFSFIASFKNRNQERVRLFLDSLQNQTSDDFELIFINQGSDASVNSWIEKLLPAYSFIIYYHNFTEGYLWNKSNALNIGIKAARGEYIIVADIDLIFLPDYLEKIGKLLQPGIFITHNVFYIPESFLLEKINDVTSQQHNDKFKEGFHSACVAKKDALVNINGFDEFYLVWGVEDDDIIKRLKESGQVQKHLLATELNIYHQWHPEGSPGKPLTWYLLMVNHLFSLKPKHDCDIPWGKVLSLEHRPVLKFINEKSYKQVAMLQFWPNHTLLFFNPFMEGFHKLMTGEAAYLEYTHILEEEKESRNFNFFRTKEIINAVAEKITNKDISQFFQFFIGYNRALLQDYYYEEKGNQFLFVCIKKVN